MFNPFGKVIKQVYGPYDVEAHGLTRRYMVFNFVDDTRTSMSYARWLMTQHLQKRIPDDLEVDHVNENRMDDRIDNYQLLTRTENVRKANLGKPSPFAGIEKGWTHGTSYGFMRKKCKCLECELAKRVFNDNRNAKRRLKPGCGIRGPRGPNGLPAEHGTRKRYNRGCHCVLCTAANTEAERKRRAGVAQW